MRRELVVNLALVAVRGRDLQLPDAAQLVELRKEDIAERIEPRRVPQQHAVEPTHAPLPSGHRAELRAEFAANAAEAVGDVALDLRWERTGADARAVRFRRTDDSIHGARPDAGSGEDAGRDRLRRRNERIGAVIDVEQRPLRAFQQNVQPALQRAADSERRIGDVRREAFRVALVLGDDLLRVERQLVVDLRENGVLLFEVHF